MGTELHRGGERLVIACLADAGDDGLRAAQQRRDPSSSDAERLAPDHHVVWYHIGMRARRLSRGGDNTRGDRPASPGRYEAVRRRLETRS